MEIWNKSKNRSGYFFEKTFPPYGFFLIFSYHFKNSIPPDSKLISEKYTSLSKKIFKSIKQKLIKGTKD